MKTILFIALTLSSLQIFAEPGKMTFYGKLMSFNATDATIQTENKTNVIVPRNSVEPKVEGVLVGRGMVKAYVSFEDFLMLNPKMNELFKKTQQKNKNP
jgi:hypothetical protein